MDLELSDEQRWLSESVETLLTREWVGAEQAFAADDQQRARPSAVIDSAGQRHADPERACQWQQDQPSFQRGAPAQRLEVDW